MPIKMHQSTLVFSLSVLLGTIFAFTATPAHAVAQAEVEQGKTASQKPPEASPATEDVVHVHIEIRKWKLSPEELEAIKTQKNRDWIALATRDDAKTQVVHIFDSVIKAGEIGKKGKRASSRTSFSSGMDVPYVKGSKGTGSGQTGAPISYQKLGYTVELYSKWSDEVTRNEIEADFDIRFSDMVSQTGITSSPAFLSINQNYTTVATLGEQQVFLHLMNRRVGNEDKVFAYLFSFRFDKVETK